MKKLILFFTLFFYAIHSNSDIKTTYSFTPEPIDVVIPCHEKDLRTLNLVIKGIRENGKNIRKIVVISAKPLTNEAEWISEEIFPFDKNSMILAIANGDKNLAKKLPRRRVGWIYQQLLKLYAPFVIEDISPNVLVLDADTIFLNPVEFINEKGEPYFNVGTEHVKEYFEHAARLLDKPFTIRRVFPKHSGICHHMILQRPVLEDLFTKIEKKSNKPTWKTLCYYIDLTYIKKSCLSEYEIYFNFIMSRTNQAKIRPLKWANVAFKGNIVNLYKKRGYHYISCHTYKK